MGTSEDIRLVQRALDRSRGAVDELARRIRPPIHAEISRLLMRMAPVHGRNPRQELDDLVQDAFLALFDRQARRLAGWDPARGCTLDSYVQLVARTRALDVLRSRRRTPWQTDGDGEEIDGPDGQPDHESVTFAREALMELERRLHELLGPRDYSMFIALLVDEMSPADVAAALGMTPAAVYQWSSRFRRNTLPRLLDTLEVPGVNAGVAR